MGHNQVVASHLALQGETSFDPPNGRMKEENCFHAFLREVAPVVPTPKMRHLVQQNCLELCHRELMPPATGYANCSLRKSPTASSPHTRGAAAVHTHECTR